MSFKVQGVLRWGTRQKDFPNILRSYVDIALANPNGLNPNPNSLIFPLLNVNQLKSKIRFTKKTEPRKLLQSTYLKVNVFKRKRVKGCFFRPSLFTDCQWGRFFYLSPLVSPPTLFSWIVGTLHIVCRFQGDWVDRLLPSMFLAIIPYIVRMLALNPVP